MNTRENQSENLNRLIVRFIREKKPNSVKELVRLIRKKHPFSGEEIIEHVLLLRAQGKITLTEDTISFQKSLFRFVFSENSIWFWFTLILVFFTTLLVVAVAENFTPLVYARSVLALFSILFLPGYCFIRVIFAQKELQHLEKVMFSLGFSILFIFLTGLLLNYSPWGIAFTPVVLSMMILIISFSVMALVQEYRKKI